MTREDAIQRVCVALDVPTAAAACRLATALKGRVGYVKVGMELYNSEGPNILQSLRDIGMRIFLDLKFHDIPNTVAGASRVIAPLGVSIFNVHASGGIDMMRAALEAAREISRKNESQCPKIIAVTVLTSLDNTTYQSVSQSTVSVQEHCVHLAQLAQQSGLDGVVASPQEIELIRAACGPKFAIVTPGVRPVGGISGDQKRMATPAGAIRAGADILVIGRPITAANNPAEAAEAIIGEIQALHVSKN